MSTGVNDDDDDDWRQQLADVESLLLATPNDESLMKLRDDLVKIIELTEKANGTKHTLSNWDAGDRCMALWQDSEYYVAKVHSVPDANGRMIVTYLQYGNSVELNVSQVKPFEPAATSELGRGVAVLAQWKDGMFYEAVIEQMLSNGMLLVKYKKYKQREEVAPTDVLIPPKKKISTEELTEKVVIPDYLKVLPGDPQKVRESKRRRVKKLKYEHKERVQEAVSTKRQNSWQKFQANVKKKKTVSMFATPTSSDGRVGVVGSGKGMTKVTDTRKKTLQQLAGLQQQQIDNGDDEAAPPPPTTTR